VFTELQTIERLVHLVIGKPVAWILYAGWLVIVYLAFAAVWVHKRLRHKKPLAVGR
jgi:hypothetical protein